MIIYMKISRLLISLTKKEFKKMKKNLIIPFMIWNPVMSVCAFLYGNLGQHWLLMVSKDLKEDNGARIIEVLFGSTQELTPIPKKI